MSKSSIFVIGLVLLFLTSIASADIANLSTEVGSTYINWSWNYLNSTTTSIYLDGQFVTNTTLTYFIASNLNSREQHTLSLTENLTQTVVASNSVKTFYPPILFYLILIFSIGFLLLEIFLKSETLTILIGTLCFVMSTLGFYMSFPYHFSILSYLMIGIAVIALLWIFMAAFSSLSKSNNTEEDII